MDDLEEWRPIVRYEGLYEVSSFGRIRNIRTGQILSPNPLPKGYLQTTLCKKGIETKFLIHTLVLTVFDRPKQEGEVCRHLDGDPSNNRRSNLQWGTTAENQMDAKKHGTRQVGNLTDDQVREVRRLLAQGMSQSKVADLMGIGQSSISALVRGTTHKKK